MSGHASAPAVGCDTRSSDAELTDAIRAGDEPAFASLVARHHTRLVRTAQRFVRDAAAAEDVAQDTWMGFLGSLDRFEGRCSVSTWLLRILFHKAKSRASRDAKLVPFSTFASEDPSYDSVSADPSRFANGCDSLTPDLCMEYPTWRSDPEQILLDKEAHTTVRRAIADLPTALATVIDLRDVQGFTAKEVCDALGLTQANQRVLLHRARSRVRAALSKHFAVPV